MNAYLLIAGLLAFATGLVHSLLGERLIFRRMRTSGFVPTNGGQMLREQYVRILWASWHAVTAFGWSLGSILVWLSLPSSQARALAPLCMVIAIAMLASSFLVLVGTRGKHPGWLSLLAIAALTAVGMRT
jgi:branched-subunit amino acid ABC-type transport system permease component